jgi:hypothetical protein
LNANWNVILSIAVLRKGIYPAESIFPAKGSRTVSEENTKIYGVVIPVQIIDAATDKHLKTVERIYEAVELFLTSTYKTITKEFMNEPW